MIRRKRNRPTVRQRIARWAGGLSDAFDDLAEWANPTDPEPSVVVDDEGYYNCTHCGQRFEHVPQVHELERLYGLDSEE